MVRERGRERWWGGRKGERDCGEGWRERDGGKEEGGNSSRRRGEAGMRE